MMCEQNVAYCDRKWLNNEDSPSTGSFVAYCGPDPWGDKKTMTFVEISDCHNKIRLHMSQIDTKADFVCKLIRLRKGLNQFIEYLQAGEAQ